MGSNLKWYMRYNCQIWWNFCKKVCYSPWAIKQPYTVILRKHLNLLLCLCYVMFMLCYVYVMLCLCYVMFMFQPVKLRFSGYFCLKNFKTEKYQFFFHFPSSLFWTTSLTVQISIRWFSKAHETLSSKIDQQWSMQYEFGPELFVVANLQDAQMCDIITW